MSANLRKFVNPRFIKTVDLALMRRLMMRYPDATSAEIIDFLSGSEAEARAKLGELLLGPEDRYPRALCADLHRIAELGSSTGLNIMIEEACRRRIDVFPDLKIADEKSANPKHDPKHIAVRVFLEHPELFEAASDHMVLRSADRYASFMGASGNVTVDLTEAKTEALRVAIGAHYREAYQGDYCRLGVYSDAGEINIVVTHGSTVSTIPVLEGESERIISIRSVSHALLRYSEVTGILRMASFKMSLRQVVADLFAGIVLERPDFFAAATAQDLYTLGPVERSGAGFAFGHGWEPLIDRVVILSATATLFGSGKGRRTPSRSLMSTDP